MKSLLFSIMQKLSKPSKTAPTPLTGELQRLIGKRAGDFFEYAISEENDCLVCSTYFRKLLKDNGIDFDNFQFTKKEELLISFGRALAKDPKKHSG